MTDLLFLAHRAPFAPDRGDRIRAYHVLRHLTERARVHLVAFADDPRDRSPPPEWRERLASCAVVPRGRMRVGAALGALVEGRPLSVAAFADRRVAEAVARVGRMDAAYVFSGQMAQYLPVSAERVVMDFVDADSAKFAAYAAGARGGMRNNPPPPPPPGGAAGARGGMRALWSREARTLAAWERDVAGRVDASLFVSAAEAAALPGAGVLENGIDADVFDPAIVSSAPASGPLAVFTGQMDYRPNVEAATWFAREALPRVLAARPDLRFAIVGRAPTAAVRALAGPSVLVTGEVADVRPWLAAAHVAVAPLLTARGVQNKVLEAMAMARPVVATPQAAEGIDHAGTIAVADGAEAFAAAVLAALNRRGAPDARAQVRRRYAWPARLAPLDELLGLAPPVMSAAA